MGKRTAKVTFAPEPTVRDVSEEDQGVEESDDEKGEQSEDENGEDDDESEDEQLENEPPSKRQKLSAQDIQVARETAELFKSNIFKLQIDELIGEVKLKEAHLTKIEKVLHRLHDCISQVPNSEELSLSQAEALFNPKKLTIPFPDPKPSKTNYSFSYLAPQDVNLVGSFGLKTGITQVNGMSIDIALTMPSSLFQHKDYLNYRALHKRAFYITYLAEHLIPLTKKNNLPVKISYKFLNDDILCPVLKLESIQTENPNDLSFHKTKFTINIVVAFPFGVFDSKKMLPDKNCIRVQTPDDSQELPPTPWYNSSILSLCSYDYYLKYLYTHKKSTEAFKDACILGRLWLQQRGLGSSLNAGGFGHFEFAMLMAALLNGGGSSGNKILLHGFSSYQLFKATVKYIATNDLCAGYLSFSSAAGESVTSKYVSDGFDVPTIFDKNVKLNILWKMSKSSYVDLQVHAQDTLLLLNDVVKDRFDAILLKNATVPELKYDIVFSVKVPESVFDSFGALEKISFITFDNFIKHKLYLILKNALGDRVTQVHIRSEKVSSVYPITKRKPSSINNKFIVGLKLNSDESEKLVTKGPNNEDEEDGVKFRAFWGPKASLRRFKNGTIQHCVVWELVNNEPITLTIVKYVLDFHLSPDISHDIRADAKAFNDMLPQPLLALSAQGVTSSSSFTNLKNAFESLSKILANLELPLSVKSLMPASPGCRNTTVLHPVPFAVSNPDFWNDAVLQFETSSRWPDEISALEKTKTAFLLKIDELLNSETTYKSFITKDDTIPFNDDITLLNVLTPNGYGFRIRVLSERDEILYLRAVANSDKQKAVVQDIYLRFVQKYIGSVKHTRTVSILANYFPFYSPTVRLFKRWLDSQLLLHHFKDELLELIALKPFVDPAPYSTPNSVESGFLQILHFLANWNWKEDALILDLVRNQAEDFAEFKLSDKLSIQAYQVIESNFDKIRKNDPTGIKTQFFVGSKDDPSGILWSNELNLPIASRLTALSRAAIEVISNQGVTSSLPLLFTPALQDFDFVVHVKGNNIAVSSGLMPEKGFKNLIGTLTSYPENVTSKYDLIQEYYRELNKKFGNVIIFSTRKYTGLEKDGSNVIGCIFVPTNLTKKKFRVNLGINFKPVEGSKEEVVINKEAVLDQIKLLGGDLVQSLST